MNIYVDDLMSFSESSYHGAGSRQARRVGSRFGHRWCHLFADAADCQELHDFAARIGMRREWFQGDHYDLVPPKRALAVKLGAKEVDRTTAVSVRKLQSRVLGDRRCPRCGSAVMEGYGLAAGGLGPYVFCIGDECSWMEAEKEA